MIKLENDRDLEPKNERMYLMVLIVFIGILLALGISQCQAQTNTPKAQIDTVMCRIECIDNIIVTSTEPLKVYAIYHDEQYGISDLIPISKSVYSYIEQCQKYHIEPSLGIRLKDGQITGIVKYKQHYKIRRR